MLFAFLAAAAAAAGAEPVRILIVYEPDGSQTAVIETAKGLRSRLDDPNPTAFEIYSEYLDTTRFPGAGPRARMTALLAAKYGDVKLDAVIALGPNAFTFMLDNRDKIAPGVPLVFGGLSALSSATQNLPPGVWGLLSQFDLKQTLSLARRLQPNTRRAVVVFGSGSFDKEWEVSAREVLGDRYLDFDIDYLTGLSLEGFADALRQLPQDSVVLMLTINQDSDGSKFVPREATAKLASVSNVPIYTVYDTYVDAGAIGGSMSTFRNLGEQIAELAMKVIQGDTGVSQITALTSHLIVNERVMARYGIDSGLVPPGSEIRFHETSLWEKYKAEIVAIIAIILLQSGLIAALLVQARRRRTIEAELAQGQRELTHLSRASMLGELSGAFAHELNQPLTSILANAEVGRRLLDQVPEAADLSELREIFADIVADDKRAADVIGQLRRLLTKGDATLEPVDLSQVVVSTLNLANGELVARRTKVNFMHPLHEIRILGNFAQLQQIVLNLMTNAIDATAGLSTAERQVEIVVRQKGRFAELAVSDNGPGLTAEMMDEVFKPFVSTKPGGLGLGLQICRSIASAHGGTLAFDSHHAHGARIVLQLPLQD
jgi:signal transduction histidine kinase